MRFQRKSPKLLSLIIAVLISPALALSLRYSRIREGDIFAPSSAVVMIQIFKLTICLCATYHEHMDIRIWLKDLKTTLITNYADTLKIGLPSFLYVLLNNLLFVATYHLDAATYQVTYQLRIFFTALCSMVMLNKKLSMLQWTSFLLLVTGVVLVQLEKKDESSRSERRNEQNWLTGLLAVIAAGVLSSSSGVFLEKIVKASPGISVWMRNVQLSVCSLPLAILMCFYADYNGKGFFFGYDAFVWYLITLQACGGLVAAMVIKYADNILKGFATSVGIVLTCLISSLFMDFQMTVTFLIGTTLVIASVFLYGYQPSSGMPTKLFLPKVV